MSMSGQNQTSTPCSPPTPTDTLDADPELSVANDTNLSTGSEATAAQKKRFPRFLVIEGLDPNKTLRRANGTILDKTIDGATSVTTKREWMDKAVLVEVNCGAYSNNLLKLTQIGYMPVRVSAHRSLNYAKGVVRFHQAAQDLTNGRPGQGSQHVKAQPRPAPGERCQQGYHNQGWQEGANRNLFPDLWCPNSTRAHLSWLWEIWRRKIHSPSPDAASSVSNLTMEHAPVGLLKISAPCVWALTNRKISRTSNLANAQTVTVHILPPAGNTQHSSRRKELSRSKWRVTAHFLQPGSKQGRPLQPKWQWTHMPKS